MRAHELIDEMAAARKFSDDDREHMRDLYAQGLSLSEISQKLGIIAPSVRKNIIALVGEQGWLKLQQVNSQARANIGKADSKNKNLTTSQVRAMYQAIKGGETITSVAERYKIERSSVARAIKSLYTPEEWHKLIQSQQAARDNDISNYTRRTRKYSLEQVEKMKSMYVSGKNFVEIGQAFNEPDATIIRNAIKRLVGRDTLLTLKQAHNRARKSVAKV